MVEWHAQRVLLMTLVSSWSASLALEPWLWGSRCGGGWRGWCRVPDKLLQKCLEAFKFRAGHMSAWW